MTATPTIKAVTSLKDCRKLFSKHGKATVESSGVYQAPGNECFSGTETNLSSNNLLSFGVGVEGQLPGKTVLFDAEMAEAIAAKLRMARPVTAVYSPGLSNIDKLNQDFKDALHEILSSEMEPDLPEGYKAWGDIELHESRGGGKIVWSHQDSVGTS